MITTSPAPVSVRVALPPQPASTPEEEKPQRAEAPWLNAGWGLRNDPGPIDYAWPGGPEVGTVGAIIAEGGAGKSFLALQIACAIAGAGYPKTDIIGIEPDTAGDVLYLSYEDSMHQTYKRLYSIGQYIDDEEGIKAIERHLFIRSILGFAGQEDWDLASSAMAQGIIDWAEFRAESAKAEKETPPQTRLIIVDTLSQAHTLEENSNEDMAHVLKELSRVAQHTGSAVIFLHHSNKSAARDGAEDRQQASRGASAIINNARWAAYMSKMTAEEAKRWQHSDSESGEMIPEEERWRFVRWGTMKINGGTPRSDEWLNRSSEGVLRPFRNLVRIEGRAEQERPPQKAAQKEWATGGRF